MTKELKGSSVIRNGIFSWYFLSLKSISANCFASGIKYFNIFFVAHNEIASWLVNLFKERKTGNFK